MAPVYRLPLLLVPVALGAACGEAPVRVGEPAAAELERLWDESATGLAPTAGHGLYISASPSTWSVSPDGATLEIDDADLRVRDAVVDPSGEVLIATDQGLFTLVSSGEAADLRGSTLQDALSGAPTRALTRGQDLWVQTEAGLHRWRGGTARAITLDGEAITGPFAVGGAVDGAEVVWVAGAGGLAALDTASWQTVAWHRRVEASALAVDSAGLLWAIEDGDLWVADAAGELSRARLDEALVGLAASPSAAGVWALGESTLYRGEDGALTPLEPDENLDSLDRIDPSALRVDALGRLVGRDDSGAWRAGTGPVVLVLGLDDGEQIEGTLSLRLVPTRPEDVTALAAEIDGAALAVSGDATDGWSAELVASDWLDGAEHALSATATYVDGAVVDSEPVRFLSVDLGTVTWAGQIEPLFQDNCEICHGGASETQLDSAEAWISSIELILDNVRSGAMPLGRDPLSDLQISMIEAWQDGGFALE